MPPSPQMDQFEAMRRRAQQQAEASRQQGQDALKRQYASTGGLSSGAYVKQQQIAEDASARQSGEAMQGIDALQQQENQRQAEIKQAQEFQSGEAEKQRGFATHEREAGQQFTGGMFGEDLALKRRAFESGEAFQNKEFELNKIISAINSIPIFKDASPEAIANAQAQLSQLGIGIGANGQFVINGSSGAASGPSLVVPNQDSGIPGLSPTAYAKAKEYFDRFYGKDGSRGWTFDRWARGPGVQMFGG